ncbi:hypothetical protein NFI96_004517, partial [Prochilodus magdalenae]
KTGSPGKISKLQTTEDAEDRYENGDKDMTVEMDAAEQTDEDQDMSSEDEGESLEAVVKRYVRYVVQIS